MGRPGSDPYTYEAEVICVTENPLSIKVTPVHPHKPIPFWVPKSVIHDDSEVWKMGDEGKLIVVESWAEKEGWS